MRTPSTKAGYRLRTSLPLSLFVFFGCVRAAAPPTCDTRQSAQRSNSGLPSAGVGSSALRSIGTLASAELRHRCAHSTRHTSSHRHLSATKTTMIVYDNDSGRHPQMCVM